MKAYLHRRVTTLAASVAAFIVLGAVTASSALAGVPSAPRGIFSSTGVGGTLTLANLRSAGGRVTLANDLYGLAVLFGLTAVVIASSVIAERRRTVSGDLAAVVKLHDDSSAIHKAA